MSADQLHPIALEASMCFLKDARGFSEASIAKIAASLESLRGQPELGPAVASLIQVAQHLETVEKARPAALALMRVAMSQTGALEAVNRKAQLAGEDVARRKRQEFAKFSGQR